MGGCGFAFSLVPWLFCLAWRIHRSWLWPLTQSLSLFIMSSFLLQTGDLLQVFKHPTILTLSVPGLIYGVITGLLFAFGSEKV